MDNCPHASLKKRGVTKWLECNIDNAICPFSRRCGQLNTVINTKEAEFCKRRGVTNG